MPTSQGKLSSEATRRKNWILVLICLALVMPTIQKDIKKGIWSVFVDDLPLRR
jgi:hypothetical protein